MRSGSALSAQFAVPFKQPAVLIETESGHSYAADARVLLSGDATDLQDNEIADSNLVWSSNLSGRLGTGGELVVTLPVGEHTITLTATNSGGVASSASIVVRVGLATPVQ